MKIITLAGPDLSSRRTAAVAREDVLSHIAAEGKVVVDLTSVLSISESYADELFGVIASVYGLSWLHQHVTVRVSQEHVLRSIAVALKHRLALTPPVPASGERDCIRE